MVKKWQKLDSKLIGDHWVFKIRHDKSRSPRTGKVHTFSIIEAGDWINVIPITPQGKVIFIHQYRHGTEEVALEIPGGMIDEDDVSPLESAQRELREETGYEANKLLPIGSVAPNPAILTNRCYTFLALGAQLVGQPQLEGSEDIQVELIDLAQVPSLITNGQITHALVVAAFYHFDQYQRMNPDWSAREGGV